MAVEKVVDNVARHRFELDVDGQVSFADYHKDGSHLIVTHVEAPPALRGTGVAGRLMEGVLAAARTERLQVIPLCSYAAAYIRRHREHQDLLAS